MRGRRWQQSSSADAAVSVEISGSNTTSRVCRHRLGLDRRRRHARDLHRATARSTRTRPPRSPVCPRTPAPRARSQPRSPGGRSSGSGSSCGETPASSSHAANASPSRTTTSPEFERTCPRRPPSPAAWRPKDFEEAREDIEQLPLLTDAHSIALHTRDRLVALVPTIPTNVVQQIDRRLKANGPQLVGAKQPAATLLRALEPCGMTRRPPSSGSSATC
jgi:hypothetical protein